MTSKAAKRKAKAQRRAGHGERPSRPVIQDRLQIGDETTTVSYAVDSVMMMFQNGSINGRLAAAGARFRAAFNEASTSNVPAMDYGEPVGLGGPGSIWPAGGVAWVSWAREVQPALTALGGPENPMRLVAWHVLGLGRSLRDFSRNIGWAGKKPRDTKEASGVLTATLSTLADHYDN